jgi:hypothetical protein
MFVGFYENNVEVKMRKLGRKRSLVLEVGNDLFLWGTRMENVLGNMVKVVGFV